MQQSGRLFYLIGASGAGKDSLLDYLRHHLPATAPVEIARRSITRSRTKAGEKHRSITRDEFDEKLRNGRFVMHWESHGYCYGIGREVRNWLEEGKRVVVNGSRAYLAEASAKFPELHPVLVSVEPEVLRGRLEQRGRESASEIARRLQRAGRYRVSLSHPRLVTIDNSGELDAAGTQLLHTVLRGLH
jgi:ribose 1,5-bisphosphokinase